MTKLQKLIVVKGCLSILLFLFSCAGRQKLPPETVGGIDEIVKPPPALVEQQADVESQIELSADSKLIQQLSVYKPLQKIRVIAVRVFPQNAEAWQLSDGELVILSEERRKKDTVWFHTAAGALAFRAQDYEPLIVPVPADIDSVFSIKLEHRDSPVRRIGEISTGLSPKSVRFSPDGHFLYTTHLSDRIAVRKYRVDPLEKEQDLYVHQDYVENEGFVESLFLHTRKELWITQMSRDTVHVFELDTGNYLANISLSGNWPKVLLASASEDSVYVSCWISESISIIETDSFRELKSIPVGGIPRGLSLAPNGRDVLIARYSDSSVVQLDIANNQIGAIYNSRPGVINAMRHIVHDHRRKEYYITAMAVRKVYRLSEDGQWLGYWEVGHDPNTCVISPNGRWLVVSCRGPNNPDTGYLTKGYEFGKIYFINLETGKVEAWIWGQDQPTGIDISPDSQYLAFTNFLSDNLELYKFIDYQD